MLISMLSTGTRGDTQPFIALGLELKKKGFQVRIAASQSYRTLIEGYGFDFAPLRGDVAKIIESGMVKEADNPLAFFTSLKNEELMDLMIESQEDLHKACDGSDAIVYHPGASIGYFAAKEMGIPSILASPFPMTPTNEYPAIIFYDRVRFGKMINKVTHRIFEMGFWKMSNPALKMYWKKRYGKLPEGFGSPYPRQRTKESPTLVSLSPSVFPVPRDWPNHVYSFGYWFIEDHEEYEPSEELQQFLKNGEPPVYVGFGSVGGKDQAAEATERVVKALKTAGKRGLIHTGGGLEKGENTKDLFFFNGAPHEWLFPQMSGVVHHGGAGTTAAALRAGVPQAVIPFGNDQFAWGKRMNELGVSAKAIPRKELTAEKLADTILYSQTGEVLAKAKEIGERVRAEKGAEKAANLIMKTIHTFNDKEKMVHAESK
ncbi:glycosyltransferase [Bacillus sp. FJAT-42376]|uniref:glycosyltransferase n=1 Tax=Bacillus sp. FJAT-42376 TaxID=2014076 RepID=UPI000F4F6B4C|nr:glycosyltransferase [Bacillus sp. FJAT-42376]AZB41759.1 glycosyltransferase [Bacillus sp. FJAT-42376]